MTGRMRRIGNKGFTLIELLVVIVIVVIMAAVGFPSLLGMIQRSEIDGASRHVLYEIRAAQSLAVTRGDDFGFHWGGDPFVGMAPSVYRIETDPTGACGWPPPADTAATNANVIRDWFDMSVEYPGIVIQSIADNVGAPLGGVMFNSRGASVNCITPAIFPLGVRIVDNSGSQRCVEIQRAGRVTITVPAAPMFTCPQ